MFCSEILSFEETPAVLDYSALAPNQERSDAAGRSNTGVSGGNRTVVSKSDMIE
jgi:hypothetical protein